MYPLRPSHFLAVLAVLSFQSQAEACDFTIKSVSQLNSSLSFDIHSSRANINPYKVTLMQEGKAVGQWPSVPHTAGKPLVVNGVNLSGVVKVRIQSTKDAACVAEESFSADPVSSGSAACDLVIKNFSYSAGNLLLDIHSSQANLNPYSAQLLKGDKVIGTWPKLPHQAGQLLQLPGVSASGEMRVKLQSSTKSACSAERVITLVGDLVSDDKKCTEGPSIESISEVSNVGLLARFHGVNVKGIDYQIKKSTGEVVESGAFTPQNNSPRLTFSYLDKGEYKLTFKGNTCTGEDTKAFSITSGSAAPPVSAPSKSLKKCVEGPEIRNITNVSNSGLSILFHGVDVLGMEYKILNGQGSAVASGPIVPQNNTPSISFASQAPGDYTLVLDGVSCSGKSMRTFSIAGASLPSPAPAPSPAPSKSPVPAPQLPPPSSANNGNRESAEGELKTCPSGPEILDVGNVTSTGLIARFHGNGISGMDYLIKDSSGRIVTTGKITPQNATPSLNFRNLNAGDYTLVLKGSTCAGQSSKPFSISNPKIPDVAQGPQECKNGPTIKSISNVSKQGLSAQIEAQGVSSLEHVILDAGGRPVTSVLSASSITSPSLSFSALSDGDYYLVSKATNCEGSSTLGFKVSTVVAPRPTDNNQDQSGGVNVNVACDPNRVIQKTLQTTYNGDNKFSGDPKSQSSTVLSMPTFEGRVDRWKELGGTAIAYHHEWSHTNYAEGKYDYRELDYALNYARKKGLRVILKFSTLLTKGNPGGAQYDTIADHLYGPDDMVRSFEKGDECNWMNPSNCRMTFSSPKWERAYTWVRKTAEHIRETGHTSTIYYGFLYHTQEHEIAYSGGGTTRLDNHPLERQAFKDYVISKYGSDVYNGDMPNHIGSGKREKDFFVFRTLQLAKNINTWAKILADNGIAAGVDSGSMGDGDSNRNTWGLLTDVLSSDVKVLKQNPDGSFPEPFVSKTLSCSGRYSSLEWTNVKNHDMDQPVNFANHTKVSMDAGVSDISFSFFQDLDRNDSILQKLRDIKGMLEQSGHWNKKQVCGTPKETLVHGTDVALQHGGWDGHTAGEFGNLLRKYGNPVDVCVKLNLDR